MHEKLRLSAAIVVAAMLAAGAGPIFAAGSDDSGSATGRPTMEIYANYWDRNPSWSPETLVLAKFAEISGADIELVHGDREKFKTLIASGNVPDLSWNSASRLETQDWGTKGLLYPIDTLFDQMPNLAQWRRQYPQYDQAMTAFDGHQYGTTGVFNFTPLSRVPSMSPRAHDIGVDPQKDIQTMEDLADVLGQFKARWPQNHPWVTRGGIEKGYHQMFGTDASIYHNPESDEFVYGPTEDNFRDMTALLARAWADGLMHPDFMSMGEDPWREIMSADKAYFTTGWYTQISWSGTDRADPNTWWIPIIAPTFNGKQYYSTRGRGLVNDTNLWSLAADTEVADNAAALIDWLYTDDGVYYIYFGDAGVTSTLDEHGYGSYKRDHIPEADRTLWMWEQGFHFFRYNVNHTLWETNPVRPGSLGGKVFADETTEMYVSSGTVRPAGPILGFTEEESDQRKQLQADLETVALEGAAAFIRGSRPMSQWSDFQRELERVGVRQLEAIYNAAYDRVKAMR